MATNQPFCHLHFHTGYSLLDGACKVDQVMEVAQELGMPAVAITDHGVMYGAISFYKKAKAKGIKPILGCEVYMAPEGLTMYDRKRSATGSQSNHFVLLAENEVGFQNLQKLVSQAHLEGFYYKPRIDRNLLREYSEGLIGLSACLKGEIPEMIVQGNLEGAVQRAEEYIDILGKDNFYLELQDHGINEQRMANEGLIEVSRRTGLPLVASNDVHYIRPSDWEAHDVMICLQTQSVMSDPDRMKYNSTQFYMKSQQEMYDLFKDHPEALARTVDIAERCNVDLNLGNELHFPKYEVPEGENQKSYLLKLTLQGIRERYGLENFKAPRNDEEERIVKRFKHEFEVIEQTGFINYFLVVWDFIRFAKDRGIPVGPGRGSGAGSIVAYALGITGIDPLRYNLIFERFLNPQRVSPPDFDIDFCQARRGEVIEYVKDKYGRSNVAQIITFGTLGAKTVIRDIGRVLEIPLNECDRLAKMVPDDPGMTLEKALQANPEFKRATEREENAKQIMKYARVLEGLPRNPGTHAAGVVIGERPLEELIPLSRDKDKEVVTQFEMKPLEEVGLLKMDFLGLRTLTLIQGAVHNVKRTRGIDIDIDKIPMEDEPTFRLLSRGDTIGVFQVESKGMRDLLRRLGLNRFEDLIALIALYRPGPMNMLDDFIARKHGKVKIKYDHPKLETVLNETYGVMIYQEQVQQAANLLAGFTLGEGDILRRAMGKKIMSEMTSQRQKFVEGCKTTSEIPASQAEKIFDNIERFAGYGFNKSHSAAYAILSWQTAYLKANYPTEFMASLLTSELSNNDKLPVLIAECQQMDIEVLPPNVNDSEVNFKPVEGGIRFGLAGVKNIGIGAVEALVAEREAHGPYTGLVDFCSRVDSQQVNKKALESLVTCGAFDFTKMSRGRLFNGIEFAMSRAAETMRDKASGQGSLFDMMASESSSTEVEELPPSDPWPESKMLIEEKNLLGFYISGHPLTEHAWALSTYSTVKADELEQVEPDTMIRVGGLVAGFLKRFTKRTQEAMGIFRLEHLQGSMEAVAFPEAFRQYGSHLLDEAPVMLCGQLKKEDALKIIVSEVYPLASVHTAFGEKVSLHIPVTTEDAIDFEEIQTVLRRHPGETQVVFCLQFAGGEKVFVNTDRHFKVAASKALVHDLEHILGEESVYVRVTQRVCKHENQRNGRNHFARKREAAAVS